MIKDTTKKRASKGTPKPTNDREAQRCELLQKEKELSSRKDKFFLGSSWDEVLLLRPEEINNQADASELIQLQEDFRLFSEEWKLLFANDDVVQELNKKHAAIHTDQFYILTEKDNHIFGGKDFMLESKQSFKSLYENKRVQCFDGKMRSKANIWLSSPSRREYQGIVFDPVTSSETLEAAGLYNIWKGYTRAPKAGDASKYWEHVKDNICANDPAAYQYVRKWLACVFQRPDQVHTALVLCGSQGVGKNSFVDPLGVLLGQHYAPLGNVAELVSNFNFHLKNAVLIHANEAFWGGHKAELGMLKTMITDKTCLIEAKGKDRINVKNYKHVIMSSNEDFPVSLDPDDRRFFVLRVSEARKEDHAYFNAIQEQLNQGGYEALLSDLLNEDLVDFNPRRMPHSKSAFDIKLRSANSAQVYIYEALYEGAFFIGNDDNVPQAKIEIGVWQKEIPKLAVYKDYAAWCQINGHKIVSSNQFGTIFRKLIPLVDDKRSGQAGARVRLYVLPSLEEARNEFCKSFKVTEWIWDERSNVQEVL